MLLEQRPLMIRQVLNPFADNLPGYRDIDFTVFDLVDSSIRRGPNSIALGKFFKLDCFRADFLHQTRSV